MFSSLFRFTAWVEIVLIGDVVQIEVEQACGGSLVFCRQRHELLLEIERYGGGVCVYREETAAGLVVGEEVTFDRPYYKFAYVLSF